MERFSKKYPKTTKAIHYIGNTARIAHQAYNMAKVVASIVNAEKKYHDKSITLNPDTTGQLSCLTAMAQGDTELLRHGNSIALKSLYFKGYVKTDSENASDERIRVIVFRDMDNANAVAPTAGQLLEADTTDALRNKEFPKRFKVLMDKIFNVDVNKEHFNLKFNHKFSMTKDRKGNPTIAQHATFVGSANTDYGRGHVWMYVIGNKATAGTTSVVYANSRLRFYDN